MGLGSACVDNVQHVLLKKGLITTEVHPVEGSMCHPDGLLYDLDEYQPQHVTTVEAVTEISL